MSCPSTEELLAIAFDDVGAHDRALEHVRGCSTCAPQVQGWRETAALLQLAESSDAVSDSCLDEMTIAAIASGNASAFTAGGRAHVASCAHCRTQLAEAIELLRAPDITAEIERISRGTSAPQRRVFTMTRVALIAAALAGVLLVPALVRMRADRTSELRDSDPTITKIVAPRIIAPAGTVRRVIAFTWTSVPGASRYGVTLFTRDGTVVWQTETADTTAMLPANIELEPGSVYLYQVDAHTSWDRSAQSELAEFRIEKQTR